MKKIILFLLVLTFLPAAALPAGAAKLESIVQAEWCEDTNIPYSESGENGLPVYRNNNTFQNGLAVSLTTEQTLPGEGWYMNFAVSVPAEGYYDMTFMTSVVDSRYTSPYTVTINGGEALTVSNQSAMRVADGYDVNWAKYRLRVYLAAGENSVCFRVTDYTESSKTGTPRAVFYLDYFTLAYSDYQDITEDCEYFFDASLTDVKVAVDATVNSALRGDKKYVRVSGPSAGAEDRRYLNLRVYAPEAGDYTMTAVCTRLGVGWAGKWDMIDGDGNTYYIDAEHTAMIREVLPSADSAFCEYRLGEKVSLRQGYNTFTLAVHPKPGGGFTTLLDTISFAREESTAITIEAESCPEPGYWTAGGGRLTLNQTDEQWGYDPVGDAFVVELPFTIEQENDYYFYLDMAAANGTNNSASRMEFSVDGETWTAFDKENLRYYSKSNSGISAGYTPGVYQYEKQYMLTAGEHSLRLRVMEPIAKDDVRLQYFAVVDKIMVMQGGRTAQTLRVHAGAPYLLAGEQTQITAGIYDNYGSVMDPDEFLLEYETTDPAVLEITADGVASGRKSGYANIQVRAFSEQYGGVTAEVPVTVLSDYQGIEVIGVEKHEREIQVRLINPYHTEKSAAIVVTEYVENNGITELKAVHRVDISECIGKVQENEMRGLMEKSYTIPLDYPEAKTDVYFWNNTGEMIALWQGVYE